MSKPQWEVDGKDGSAILIVDANSPPDMSIAPFIRVYGPNKEQNAKKIVRILQSHDDLVKALQVADLQLRLYGVIEANKAIHSMIQDAIKAIGEAS